MLTCMMVSENSLFITIFVFGMFVTALHSFHNLQRQALKYHNYLANHCP